MTATIDPPYTNARGSKWKYLIRVGGDDLKCIKNILRGKNALK